MTTRNASAVDVVRQRAGSLIVLERSEMMVNVTFVENHNRHYGGYKLDHIPRIGDGVMFNNPEEIDPLFGGVVSDVIWSFTQDDDNSDVFVFVESTKEP